MRQRAGLLVASVVTLVSMGAGYGTATEYVVPTDFALLEEAVAAATDGDTITVLPGEHLVYGHIWVSDPGLVIQSIAGPATTVLRGDPPGGWEGDIIFEWGPTSTTVFRGFTLTGFTQGAIEIWDCSPALSNLVFLDCGIDGYFNAVGSAIQCLGGTPFWLESGSLKTIA